MFLVLAQATAIIAGPNCPPQGPAFEKPTNFATNGAIRAALANITDTLRARDADGSTGAFDTSYSIEIFSTSTEEPIFSWHHTAQNLSTRASPNATSYGVNTVDANTVYRLGSLTKIFTIYTWLAQDGDVKWNEPITKYIPELAAAAERAANDAVANVAWGDVTIGALASQLSGAVRDCKSVLHHLW
jgi:CubicO group peptidase (beta-lactamase class C family)